MGGAESLIGNTTDTGECGDVGFQGLVGSHFADIAFGYKAFLFDIRLVCVQLPRLLKNMGCLCGIIQLEVVLVEEASPSWAPHPLDPQSRA